MSEVSPKAKMRDMKFALTREQARKLRLENDVREAESEARSTGE